MCGIFGAINFLGRPIEPECLAVLERCMVHRGPDDNGILCDGSVAIGMRRLSIIDLAGGHQPIANEDGRIHLVLNGEIYNFRELRRELEGQGHRFRTHSDVEVILHLYEQYGTAGLGRVNGMFAFALYDQSRRLLWLARDRLGIKPLFYHHSGHRLVFSSELNGMAQVTGAPISTRALVRYLGYSYFPAPLTPYEGIMRLHPGEEIIVRDGEMKTRRYWSLNPLPAVARPISETKEQLHGLLEDAVRLQMVSDVPLGVFLSGGIDSSAIAAYAAKRIGHDPLRTFTIDFTDKGGQDADFAGLMSRRLQSEHTVIPVTSHEQQQTFEELIGLMDEPMSDTAIVPTYIVSRRAHELGVKVLLSGAGGDELFGGYPRHFPGRRLSPAWFAQLPSLLRGPAVSALGWRNPGWGIRLRNSARDFAAQISGVNFAFIGDAIAPSELYKELVDQIDDEYVTTAGRAAYPRMICDVLDYLPNNVLSLTDKGTMMASVEGRVPFLDHRLVEFAFALPEEHNLLGGEPKGLLRAALVGVVPAGILERRKEGFNAPILPWVEAHVAQVHQELLHEATPAMAGLIAPKVVRQWLEHPRRRREASSTLYALYVLNRWLRCHSF